MEEVKDRKALIQGLRTSVVRVADADWPIDETKSLLHGLLAHIGRPGTDVPTALVTKPPTVAAK